MIRRQKSSRQVGVCGSALERAPVPRKTSRIRRSRSRRLKRPLAPARRSAAVCGGLGSRAKKEPKKAYRDFQAIRRKGVVQGQSRQALMSWRACAAQGFTGDEPSRPKVDWAGGRRRMGKSLVAGSGTWSIPNYGGVRTAFQRKRRVAALKTATLFSRTITPLSVVASKKEIKGGFGPPRKPRSRSHA